MSTNTTIKELQGWTFSPNGRGTIDILWSCLATIFLSTWAVVCLNVPDPSDTQWKHLRRKILYTFIGVVGPEWLLGCALGEWQSARASVAHFKARRNDDKWTMKHAFFADMGGFVLRTSDNHRFFLDTKMIHWLLEHQAISTAQFEEHYLLDSKAIDDRNKSDTFVRLIGIGQILWFCVNVIARGTQRLAVTTLEVTTIGIIVGSVMTVYFWRHKPADVQSAVVIEIDVTLNQIILLEEDEVARTKPWFRNPLEFTSGRIWSFGLIWQYVVNILKDARPGCWRKKKGKSLGRRSETQDVFPVTGVAMLIEVGAGVVFLGTNFIAWNFHFPTLIERLLWRLSACGLVVLSAVFLFITEIFSGQKIKKMQEGISMQRRALEGYGTSIKKPRWKNRIVHKLRLFAMRLRNNSPENNPDLDVSLAFPLVGVPFAAIYYILRIYFLVEDAIALRALPADAYRTVNWPGFLPHFS